IFRWRALFLRRRWQPSSRIEMKWISC
ncbi:peptidase M23 family protein, partial [Vibrio parahaemolyticus EKP-028]